MNLFSRVGIALWGDKNAPWAQALGVSERVVRRWRNGQNEVPAGVWWELLDHVRRAREMDRGAADEWADLAAAVTEAIDDKG